MCQTMIVEMILGKVTAHSFLGNMDANEPHETCPVSASDYDSGFPMLDMTKQQPQKTLSNVNLALIRTHLVSSHAGNK